MIDIFDLGLRIRNVRKAHNLTQEQLAEKIKVSPHYVYELEHGYKSMSIYTLANIATVLDAPLDFSGVRKGTGHHPREQGLYHS